MARNDVQSASINGHHTIKPKAHSVVGSEEEGLSM